MNLMDNGVDEKSDKIKKILKISIIIAVVLFFIILAAMLYITYMDAKQLKLYVDNKKQAIGTDLLVFDENNPNRVYISIQDIAKIVGYDYYNGDFKKKTEEQNKCYLNNKKEVAGFEVGSNQLYKIDPTANDQDYDWYTLEEPVKIINGKMYATSNDIQRACNLLFTYDTEKNRMQILTLPYLVSSYESIVVNKYGFAGLDDNYKNQKSILQNMLVVKKQEGKNQYLYGVISSDNKQIIGTKYDSIEYIEIANDFYVTSAKKMGIMSSEGAQKIEPIYDEIKILDNELRLYYVKNQNIAGVVDRNGKRVVYLEYSKIGIDSSLFPSNKIKNSMILFENVIPVMKNNKWGAFDKNGNQIVDVIYDSFGFINGTRKDTSINNLLVIPSIEGIVVCRDGKYGVITSTGKFIVPCSFDKIYSVTNLGEDKFYLEYNGQVFELNDFLKENGYIDEDGNVVKIEENQTPHENTIQTVDEMNATNQQTTNTTSNTTTEQVTTTNDTTQSQVTTSADDTQSQVTTLTNNTTTQSQAVQVNQ